MKEKALMLLWVAVYIVIITAIIHVVFGVVRYEYTKRINRAYIEGCSRAASQFMNQTTTNTTISDSSIYFEEDE